MNIVGICIVFCYIITVLLSLNHFLNCKYVWENNRREIISYICFSLMPIINIVMSFDHYDTYGNDEIFKIKFRKRR